MRRQIVSVFLLSLSSIARTQTATSDESLLTKTRALYDAPFRRGLISFDCAVQFDWDKHFIEALGALPSAAIPTTTRLQTIQHRVFVDRSGAAVSAIPKAPDLNGISHAAELEEVFEKMVSGGLNSWLPFSTNVILPVGQTKFNFRKTDPGYKIAMNGPGVEATLLLGEDLRLTSVVSQLPQPMRFATDFATGPDGFLLSSVKTGSTTDAGKAEEATFAFTYQTVQGFQLPSLIVVTPSAPEIWRYALTDCKAQKGTVLEVGPPNPDPSPTPSSSLDSVMIH